MQSAKSSKRAPAPKSHFWDETSEPMPANQPSSGVGVIVALALSLSVGLLSKSSLPALSEAEGNAGLSASPGAEPWSPGKCSVGLGCVLVLLGSSGLVGVGLTWGRRVGNSESSYSWVLEASIVEPKRESCQPRKRPSAASAAVSPTRIVQSPMGFSPLQCEYD